MRSGKLLASVRLGRYAETMVMNSQWMADFYAFGGILSRIDLATDRPRPLRLLAPIRSQWQRHILRWRDADLGALKERSPSLSVLDAGLTFYSTKRTIE